jgi:zinc protease
VSPALALIFMSTLAQDSANDKDTPLSQVERKNRAPVSPELLRVSLPKPYETKIGNGLTVMILEDHRTPVVTAELTIYGAGEQFVPVEQAGVANFTAQLLNKGTKSKNGRQIAEEIERLGATLQVHASYGSESTSLQLTALKDTFDRALRATADVLVNPSFPEDEIVRLRERELAALPQMMMSPEYLVAAKFGTALYGQHPMAVEGPTTATLGQLNRAQLVKWHRERYAPQNSILTIAGDVDTPSLMSKINLLSLVWTRMAFEPALVPVPPAADTRRLHIVNRPGSVQTTLRMGNLAIDRRHEDYFALTIANRILGGGSSGRLFLNLREEKGYTYGIYSQLQARRQVGPWQISGDLKADATGDAMREILREIERLREEPVPNEELEEAKRSIVASFALSLEQPSRIMQYAADRHRYRFPPDYWDHYPAHLAAVTADDVRRVARQYLNPASLQIVAVGDAALLKPALAGFGSVEVEEAEGQQ